MNMKYCAIHHTYYGGATDTIPVTRCPMCAIRVELEAQPAPRTYEVCRALSWVDAVEQAAPSPATPKAEGDAHAKLCGIKIGSECNCGASPPAAHPSPERIQFVHGLQLLLDKLYRFHAGAMNRHEVSAFQICKNELSAFMESVKSGSLNQNDASQAAAQEQKPVATGVDVDPGAIDALKNYQRQLDPDGVEVGVSRQALDEVLAAIERVGLSASPIPASGWVMVPKEVTEKMVTAYKEKYWSPPYSGNEREYCQEEWDILLSAAPVAPGETK